MEHHLGLVVFIWVSSMHDLFNEVSPLGQLVQYCVTSWQYVIAQQFNLALINVLYINLLRHQLLHYSPMQECETQINCVHAFAVVDLVVNSEEFLVEREGFLLVI